MNILIKKRHLNKAICLSIMLSAWINSLAQRKLFIENQYFENSDTGNWYGVNISRNEPTIFAFMNCIIKSKNASGYLLQAGDERISDSNNNLDNQVITGNKLIWSGNNGESITHGIFTGYNKNALIKYNYLINVPMGIIRKSNGMSDTSGGIAYNIIINSLVSVVVKGMNNIKVYNNTFYSEKTPEQTWRGIIDIYENDGIIPPSPSMGVRVFNNIFYTVNRIPCINIYEISNLKDFESDYNLFYCESGVPVFKIAGKIIDFYEWQRMGYDRHSVILNPRFIDKNFLVPEIPLFYGINLGELWKEGLSVNATWNHRAPETILQSGKWQVGAVIHPQK